MERMRGRGGAVLLLGLAGLIGCNAIDRVGVGSGGDPRGLEGEYSWVLQRWDQGAAQGYPLVQLSWEMPTRFDREVFRVYSRRAGSGSYTLIATVTACSAGVCRYGDTNVAGGRSYDYYVAMVDERDGRELGTSRSIRVDVPQRPNLAAPPAPAAVALDGAVHLRWTGTGAERYLVLAQEEGGPTYLVGETDGTSFFDDRAENGLRYRYQLAAVDASGHVSALSQAAQAIPRPDYHADVVYAAAHHLAASGFRFVTAETADPIVPGNSPSAHWRLEEVGGVLRIQPVNQTAITAGMFTTQLTCGPGSDADCVDVRVAPAAGFASGSVAVETGFTYVLRVVGADDRTHFGKIRIQGSSVDTQGRRLIVFDWAYQLRPDEPSLNLVPRR
jgi:hypothetical protein